MAQWLRRSLRDCDHLPEQLLRSRDALFGEPDGFGLVDRIADEALLVQPVHRAPVEAFPRPAVAVERQVEQRENRIVDTQVMNGLQNGTAFFASTSMIAIGGTLALLQSAERVVAIFADLPLNSAPTRTVWEIKVIGLAMIFGYAFFKFAWAYRLFNYCVILIGALPPARGHDEREAERAIHETVEMNVAAGRHFNRGQRAFFFALAYMGWFLGPLSFIFFTAAVLVAMYR